MSEKPRCQLVPGGRLRVGALRWPSKGGRFFGCSAVAFENVVEHVSNYVSNTVFEVRQIRSRNSLNDFCPALYLMYGIIYSL